MNLRLPISTLFPYTTLFRSLLRRAQREGRTHPLGLRVRPDVLRPRDRDRSICGSTRGLPASDRGGHTHEGRGGRSEEHTSELQSRGHLVCRLLLEKKKKDYD